MNKGNNLRINCIYLLFSFLFLIIFLRISYLQIFKRNFFHNLSENQYYRLIPLQGKRGKILDSQGRVLATGISSYSVFADPATVTDIESTAQLLSSNLNLPKEEIIEKLKKPKRFIWIKRKILWKDKEKIHSFKLKGIGFVREETRFYPQEDLAGISLGIVDIDNKGLEGLELFYDSYLRGKNGWARVLQDSASTEIILSPQIIAPQDGTDIVLSLDSQIQLWAESHLRETVGEFGAKSGDVVVMDASSGEILALAAYPGSNPNDISGTSQRDRRNSAVCDMFEPGSVFKVVTLLAAVQENKFSNQDKFFCENGKFKIPGSYLHDWRPYGELSFKEVFKKSSNIGVSKIANSLGPATIYHYIKKLGFGEKTRIDFPGETEGSVKNFLHWSGTSSYIIPIGQEVATSLIQLARAFSAIANGGYLVRPHIVKSIRFYSLSKEIPVERKKIISQPAVARVKSILEEVVEDGTGKRAQIKEVKVGGKTGTAQKYDPRIRKYSPTKYRATFVGFISGLRVPLVIAVTVDEPKQSHFGGVVAAPLFRKIGEKVINYLEKE